MAFELSKAHIAAANRPRREIFHYDSQTPAYECGGMEAKNGLSLFDVYKKRLWGYIDALPHQLDSIHWDSCFEDEFAFCNKSTLPQTRMALYRQLADEGADLYDEYVRGCRARGLECILVHRISGTDEPMGALTPNKLAHPEDYIDDWTRLQNLASESMRKRKLRMLTEYMENYAFDGLEIDFCRHTPFLEPGKQWELRENVTEFLRMLREMTLRVEAETGRAVLLSCRVPETVAGCHTDGLDIETWTREKLVDTLTLGSRSFEVDIPGFRAATKGTLPLFPCFDAHHQSDAYADPGLDIYAGVLANWWAQGADAIVFFNLYACDWKTYLETCINPFTPHTHHLEEMLAVAGDPKALSALNKTYVVERKGGYPWENGFANNNQYKQLPRALKNSGAEETFQLLVLDDVAHRRVKRVTLRAVAFGLRPGDQLPLAFNGAPLEGAAIADIADKQLKPLDTEYVSGYHTDWLKDRPERFTQLVFNVAQGLVRRGQNTVTARAIRKPDYPYLSKVELERVELCVEYE